MKKYKKKIFAFSNLSLLITLTYLRIVYLVALVTKVLRLPELFRRDQFT